MAAIMGPRDPTEQHPALQLLQRSLERGRLAHGYLFSGHSLGELEAAAVWLAKTLNCQRPVKRGGVPVDYCGSCSSCQKIEHQNHSDVLWVRSESRLLLIKIHQIVRREDSPARTLLLFEDMATTESE